jgi:peptidoglycan hydrolase-like protein with peptidoglycan-binding domain/DNA invertase Pin-like site-specific DNA recombinase
MRTTYWVPGARRRGFSLVAGLALLCLAGTIVVGSPARAAEAPPAQGGPFDTGEAHPLPARAAEPAENLLLTTGDGYARPQGSIRVRALQRRLRTLGLRPGSVDGFFGPATKAAVERFQLALGLQADGIVGPRTRQALSRARGRGRLLARGAGYHRRGGSIRVRKLQRHLRRLHLHPGPVDGLYGPRTAAAVERFQRRRGFRPDGVVWPDTRRALTKAPHAAKDRPAREDGKTTPRKRGAKPPSHAAPKSQTSGSATRQTARGSSPAPARPEDDSDIGLLVLSGLAAFMLVALVTPLAKRVVAGPSTAAAGHSGTAQAYDVRPDRSDPPIRFAASGPFEAASPTENGNNRVEAVGYVTVTDPNRAKQELRGQIAAIDAVCERSGWHLTEVARDVGDVRDTALDRPGLNYALDRLENGETSCLIVAELQRLGGSAAELGRVMRWLRDRGQRLVAVDVELDTAAAEGRIAADALISVGERAEGRAPVSRRDIETGEARPGRPAVRDLPALKEHIVAMRSAGMTLQAIADRLNEEGVPTLRGGREWRPSSVQVAAGYRRPRRLSDARNYDRTTQRRRLEER